MSSFSSTRSMSTYIPLSLAAVLYVLLIPCRLVSGVPLQCLNRPLPQLLRFSSSNIVRLCFPLFGYDRLPKSSWTEVPEPAYLGIPCLHGSLMLI
ncbi:hypothetical protein IQ07DRAFT_19796 [Pyrenochaeta sp. DS3sAY3a]|nr:hypothetical protein IQ07DRAFT_19796 [Pyrenochaeta sp. DS3sAY3a]